MSAVKWIVVALSTGHDTIKKKDEGLLWIMIYIRMWILILKSAPKDPSNPWWEELWAFIKNAANIFFEYYWILCEIICDILIDFLALIIVLIEFALDEPLVLTYITLLTLLCINFTIASIYLSRKREEIFKSFYYSNKVHWPSDSFIPKRGDDPLWDATLDVTILCLRMTVVQISGCYLFDLWLNFEVLVNEYPDATWMDVFNLAIDGFGVGMYFAIPLFLVIFLILDLINHRLNDSMKIELFKKEAEKIVEKRKIILEKMIEAEKNKSLPTKERLLRYISQRWRGGK